MHSELRSNESFTSATGESRINVSQVAVEPNPQERQTVVPEDSEEVALAKAPTMMMEEEADTLEAPQHKVIEPYWTYYIQGVVQGDSIFIITNLLGRESRTLFQSQRVWTIGRNREAALPLRDRALSRRHAVILYIPQDGFYLIDLNSMNGSFVNGVRIYQRQRLKDGDRLRMGSVEFNFFISITARTVNPIHPEVLTRFTTPPTRTDEFVSYVSLEEPDLLFQLSP